VGVVVECDPFDDDRDEPELELERDRRRDELELLLSLLDEEVTRRYLPRRVEDGSMNGFTSRSAW
jgi:hypothetical protein